MRTWIAAKHTLKMRIEMWSAIRRHVDNALRVDRRICALGRGGTAEPAERSGAATGGGYILGIPCHNFFLRAPSGRLSALFANSYDGETTPHGLARSELTPK